jgi:hypothetical protein
VILVKPRSAIASLIAAGLVVSGCTNHGYSSRADTVSGVIIRLALYPQPKRDDCCRVVATNPGSRTLWGVNCYVTARDTSGRVVPTGPGGIGAAPGRHEVGYSYVKIPHARRLGAPFLGS